MTIAVIYTHRRHRNPRPYVVLYGTSYL